MSPWERLFSDCILLKWARSRTKNFHHANTAPSHYTDSSHAASCLWCETHLSAEFSSAFHHWQKFLWRYDGWYFGDGRPFRGQTWRQPPSKENSPQGNRLVIVVSTAHTAASTPKPRHHVEKDEIQQHICVCCQNTAVTKRTTRWQRPSGTGSQLVSSCLVKQVIVTVCCSWMI